MKETSFRNSGIPGFVPEQYPLCNTALFTESKGRGKRHAQDSSGVLGMIAEPTGTDGHRLRCRQFYTSSNYLLLPSLGSSKSSFHKKSKHPLSLRHSVDQGRKKFPTASLTKSGRLSLRVSLKTTSPTARLQTTMVSHAKRYA